MNTIGADRQTARTIVSIGRGPGTGFAGVIPRLLSGLLNSLLLWQQRASDRTRLTGLSDHHLRDVGLTRADVEAEATKPFWRA